MRRSAFPKFANNPFALATSAGVLAVAAFYIPYAWPLIFVAFLPLIHAALTATSRRAAFLAGMLTGAIVAGVATSWMLSIVLTSIPYPPGLAKAGMGLSWALVVLTLSPFTGLFALAARSLGVRKWLDVPVLAVLFVGCEYLRMHAFNILTFHPKIDNPAFFSFGFAGYPLADSAAWLQLATLGGLYALSFVAVLVNLCAYLALQRPPRVRRALLGSLVVLVLLISIAPIREIREYHATWTGAALSFGIMALHPQVQPGESRLDADHRALGESVPLIAGADTGILPEGSRYADLVREGAIREPAETPQLIDSRRRLDPGGRWSVAEANMHTGSGDAFIREKTVLTPQGEYMIGLYEALLRLFAYRETKDTIDGPWFRNGTESEAAEFPGGYRGSVLFCIEAVAPGFAKDLVRQQQSDVLIVLMAQAAFPLHPMSLRDTERALKVQAVEAGVSLVASAHSAYAYAIDRYGRVLERIGEAGVSQTAVVEVPVYR